MSFAREEQTQEQNLFEQMLDQTTPQKRSGSATFFAGFLKKGTIVDIRNDTAIIDAGLKAEGRVLLADLKKFEGTDREFKVGDEVDVYVDRLGDDGDIQFSAEKASREKVWMRLEQAMTDNTTIDGTIFSHVKAGYAVNIDSVVAFLPKSQADSRPWTDAQKFMNVPMKFKVMKMDRNRNNVVVSSRAVLEEERAGARQRFVADLQEEQIVEGVVKNITDYGAFIDLGGVDGLLHVIDISWKRVNHPSDVLKVGETIKVKVIRFNKETGRISLGMKQLESDPWEQIKDKVKIDDILEGEVTNITDYGAFVEIFPGIEGLVYVTEVSWTQKNVHPINFLKQNQMIKVKVMDIDLEKRRISLSYKRCQSNPWQQFLEEHPIGSVLDGTIRNITEFGLFVNVSEGLDGMVHLHDLTWDGSADAEIKRYQKGDSVKVIVLDVSPEKERINLGIKQLTPNPNAEA